MNEMYDTGIVHSIDEANPDDAQYPGTIITLKIPS